MPSASPARPITASRAGMQPCSGALPGPITSSSSLKSALVLERIMGVCTSSLRRT
jgi:hypothetical protein